MRQPLEPLFMKLSSISIVFSALVLVSFSACGPTTTSQELLIARLTEDVNILASDAFEGRATGSEGEKRAAEYIASRFREAKLSPKGDSLWFQDFTFRPHPPVRKHGEGDTTRLAMGPVQSVTGRNVIGALDRGADRWIIIGAHYDHLGMGDENSLAVGETAIHNGADDNASGVAALIELAARFATVKTNHNLLFISFSGEEKGLIGSKSFIENITIPMEKVSCMLNMDMVGRMNSERALAVYGTGTSPFWSDAIASSNADSLQLLFHESGVGPSDHTSFYLADKPVLHFFTGQHEDYHKPTDDAEKLNYAGLVDVINFVERIVLNIDANATELLAFSKTKDQSSEDAPRFKVTLGVVPDYMYDKEGMRLDGVSEERPAHTAGLIKGDIVIRMGDIEVTDIYKYMEGLALFAPGDTTPVTVLRNGEPKTFDVIWD